MSNAGRSDAHKIRMERIRLNLRHKSLLQSSANTSSSHSLLTRPEAREDIMTSEQRFITASSPTMMLLDEQRALLGEGQEERESRDPALTPTQARLRKSTQHSHKSARAKREEELTTAADLWQRRLEVREGVGKLFRLIDTEGDFTLDWRSYRESFRQVESHLAIFKPDDTTRKAARPCLACAFVCWRVYSVFLCCVLATGTSGGSLSHSLTHSPQDLQQQGPQGSPERYDADEAYGRQDDPPYRPIVLSPCVAFSALPPAASGSHPPSLPPFIRRSMVQVGQQDVV